MKFIQMYFVAISDCNKTKEDFSPETRPWPIGKKNLQRWLKNKSRCWLNWDSSQIKDSP